MRWPIRYQILVPFVGMLLAALAGVSLVGAFSAANRTGRHIENQLRDVARTLLDTRFPLNDTVLTQMRGLSGAEFVLTDGAGQIKAASGSWPELRLVPTDVIDRPEQLRLTAGPQLQDQQFLQTALSMRGRGPSSTNDVLYILFPESVLLEARFEAASTPLAVGAAALVLCVVLALVVAARISRPIREIAQRVGDLARGEFRPLPVPKRNDELSDLTRSVNQLAAELDDLRTAMVRAERLTLIGQLSGGLVHHLRNGVAGARMAVQMHKRHCETADPESLEVALRQLQLTEEHLQGFLTTANPGRLKLAPCDVAQVVREIIELVMPTCRHRGVRLSIVDRCQTASEASADRQRLQQAFLNLLVNAIDAAANGGWVRIELDLDSPTQRLWVRFIDSGAGPADQVVDTMFEPFVTTKREGIGLGLAAARDTARAHGGDLRYERIDGATCFSFSLPVRLVPATATASAQSVEWAAPHQLQR